MHYANKKFLVTANKVGENGTLETIHGTIPVFKSNRILTDEYGNVFVETEKRFNEEYVPVEIVDKKPKKTMSPFEEQYMKQLVEFGSLELQEEDEQYILGTKKIAKERL